MWYVLFVVAWLIGPAPDGSAGQPPAKPFVMIEGSYTTEAVCMTSALNLKEQADTLPRPAGVGALQFGCQPVSDPDTEKDS